MQKEITVSLPVAGDPTPNGRIYPKDVLREAIEKFTPRYCGIDGTVIDPTKYSHKVTNLDMDEEGVVTARIRILETPAGSVLKALIESGDVAYSMSSFGKVDENKVVSEQSIVGLGVLRK